VFDAAAPRLLRLAIHLAGDVGASEDLVQATFVTAMERAREFEATREIEPWLAGILGNHARNVTRSTGRSGARTDAMDVAEIVARDDRTPLDGALSKEESAELAKALDSLPEPYRAPMILRLRHGLKDADIGHVLDRSPGTVRVQLHRGREMLKKLLPAGLVASLVAIAPARGLDGVKAALLAKAGSASGSAGGRHAHRDRRLGVVVSRRRSRVRRAAPRRIGPRARARAQHARSRTSRRRRARAAPRNRPRASAPRGSRRERCASPAASSIARTRESRNPMPPAARADVSVRFDDGTWGQKPFAAFDVHCDEHGAFAFELDAHRDCLRALDARVRRRRATSRASLERAIAADATWIDDVVLERPAIGALRGETLDAYGRPLAGVLVRLAGAAPRADGNTAPLETTSDERGRFEMWPTHLPIAQLDGELAGWSLLESELPRPEEAGGFAFARIVMAPRGELVVRVSITTDARCRTSRSASAAPTSSRA
jgi:RNA polymerase sigma-70 factor (ECF subfamily)